MAGTLSVLRAVAARSQCEEVEKWGQSASQLPPSQAVGDGTGKREVLLRTGGGNLSREGAASQALRY